MKGTARPLRGHGIFCSLPVAGIVAASHDISGQAGVAGINAPGHCGSGGLQHKAPVFRLGADGWARRPMDELAATGG